MLSRSFLILVEIRIKMEVIKQNEPVAFIDESDGDLLVIMSMKDDEKTCNAAFVAFHHRYKVFLLQLIEGVCSTKANKKELVKNIFSNVLVNVFTYCHTFDAEGEVDPVKIRKKISGWLATIARHEYKSQFTRAADPKKEQVAYQRMIRSGTEKPKYNLAEERVVKAFEQIPKERDRDILRTYWVFYEKGEKSQANNMPDYVLDDMAAQYNTSKPNIRQIISRTNKIVREYLLANYKP
jgi:DNA-directed RNA polymerase specialized sigma24 family protein